MDDFPRLTGKEQLILGMLINQRELYGLQMIKDSEGMLKRGTIYVTLDRMAKKGYIDSREEKQPGRGPARRLYHATGHGKRVYQAWEMAKAAYQAGLV